MPDNPGDDFVAYPVLTEEVALATSPSGFATGRPADIGSRASAAIQEVLGWRPTRDGRGFDAALAQCFQLRQVEGHVEWHYTPRGYSASADLGAVTGIQASLVLRARTIVNGVVRPLLESLTPLSTAVLPEDYESLRALVLRETDEIVNELGMEGGPRLPYVDDRFSQLLGSASFNAILAGKSTDTSGLDVITRNLIDGRTLTGTSRGHLATLQYRMGLHRALVNTVEDERVISNFIGAVQSVADLCKGYVALRKYLRPPVNDEGQLAAGGTEPFLGTQLIQVSRAFAATGEAVNELVFILDSVFVDASERQVIALPLKDHGVMFLNEVIDWLQSVCTEQGPQAIQDAGKDGVISMADTLRRLAEVTTKTRSVAATGRPSKALRTPRVLFALDKVTARLDWLVELADQVTRSTEQEELLQPYDGPASMRIVRRPGTDHHQ